MVTNALGLLLLRLGITISSTPSSFTPSSLFTGDLGELRDIGVNGAVCNAVAVAVEIVLFLTCCFRRVWAVVGEDVERELSSLGAGNVFPIIFPRDATPLFHTNGFL
jgi:hypothetical protein